MDMTVNDLFCGMEEKDEDLKEYNFEIYTINDPDALLPVYLFDSDNLTPVVSGNFDDVYQFIYQEEYLSYNAVFVRKHDNIIKVFITYRHYDRDVMLCEKLEF